MNLDGMIDNGMDLYATVGVVMMTSWNGNIFRVTGHLCGEFPAQRRVTRSFDVFFDLRLNKRLSKQSLGWWFETLSRPLWRHRYGVACTIKSCKPIFVTNFKMF